MTNNLYPKEDSDRERPDTLTLERSRIVSEIPLS